MLKFYAFVNRHSLFDIQHSIINKVDKPKFDLENRLIDFAVRCIHLAEALPKTPVGKHLGGQLARSGSSPALNYGEAQGAESRADFIHKMRISLKELRETLVCLKIICKCNYFAVDKMERILAENNELVSIFVRSIETAKSKDMK